MTLDQLLDRLEDCGASLRFEGRKVFLINGSRLDPEDRELLKANRNEIRALVRLRNRPAKVKAEAEPEPSETRQRLDRHFWWLDMTAVRDRGLVAGFPTAGPTGGSREAPPVSARPAGYAGPARPSADAPSFRSSR